MRMMTRELLMNTVSTIAPRSIWAVEWMPWWPLTFYYPTETCRYSSWGDILRYWIAKDRLPLHRQTIAKQLLCLPKAGKWNHPRPTWQKLLETNNQCCPHFDAHVVATRSQNIADSHFWSRLANIHLHIQRWWITLPEIGVNPRNDSSECLGHISKLARRVVQIAGFPTQCNASWTLHHWQRLATNKHDSGDAKAITSYMDINMASGDKWRLSRILNHRVYFLN